MKLIIQHAFKLFSVASRMEIIYKGIIKMTQLFLKVEYFSHLLKGIPSRKTKKFWWNSRLSIFLKKAWNSFHLNKWSWWSWNFLFLRKRKCYKLSWWDPYWCDRSNLGLFYVFELSFLLLEVPRISSLQLSSIGGI